MYTIQEIRARIRSGDFLADQMLPIVEDMLTKSPSAALWILRGDLIQLSEKCLYELSEAERSYLEACRLAPSDYEAYEELGHFYDSVMDEPARAIDFYRNAIERGAGDSCVQALSELLKGLDI